MKTHTLMTTAIFAAALCVSVPSSAYDITTQDATSVPGSTVSTQAYKTLETCLTSEQASSRAVRACSKSLRLVAPSHDIKSDIYTRRGLLQMSMGRFDKASTDFVSASKLNGENEFAWLGQGFAAMLSKDYDTAMSMFEDCDKHRTTGPLANYGKAMTLEMMGDKDAAIAQYKNAAEARPGWSAPREELKRLGAI